MQDNQDIGNKLGQVELPYEEGAWEKFRVLRRKRRMVLWWRYGAVAACLVALLGLGLLCLPHRIGDPQELIAVEENLETDKKDFASATAVPSGQVQPSTKRLHQSDSPSRKSVTKTASDAALTADVADNAVAASDNAFTADAADKAVAAVEKEDQVQEQAQEQEQAQAQEQEQAPQNPIPEKQYLPLPGREADRPAKAASSGWTLGANVGTQTGRTATHKGPEYGYLYGKNPLIDPLPMSIEEKRGNIDSPSNKVYLQEVEYYELDYALPFTIGLSVMHRFTSWFAAGLSLNYTLLGGQKDYGGRYSVKETQHYVGIPVTMYFGLLNNRHFAWYVTASVGLEKGVSRYIRDTRLKVDGNVGIKGVQWSLGAGMGVEYRFASFAGLYAEPALLYFPDCEQPSSYRTEHPLQYGMSVGVRFRL